MNINSRKRSQEEAFPPLSTPRDSPVTTLFSKVKAGFEKNSVDSSLQSYIDLNPRVSLLKDLLLEGIRNKIPFEKIENLWMSFFNRAQENSENIHQKDLRTLFKEGLKNDLGEEVLLTLAKKISERDMETLLELFYYKTKPYPILLPYLIEIFLSTKPGFEKVYLCQFQKFSKILKEDLLALFLFYLLKGNLSLYRIESMRTCFSNPHLLAVIDKARLQIAFMNCSDSESLKNQTFSSFIRNDPELFSKSAFWILNPKKGLILSREFLSPVLKSSLINSVLELLLFAEEHTEFQKILSEELDNAMASCSDRSILSLNRLHLKKSFFEVRGKSEKEIFEVFRTKVATDVLEQFSAVLSEKFKDTIEIQLFLELELQDLPLIRKIHAMDYSEEAEVDQTDMINARNTILEVIQSPEAMSNALLKEEIDGSENLWVQFIQQKPEIKQELEEMKKPLFDLLDELGEKKEISSKLSEEDKACFDVFFEKNNEKGEYLASYIALKNLVEALEKKILLKWTLKIVTPFINDNLPSHNFDT